MKQIKKKTDCAKILYTGAIQGKRVIFPTSNNTWAIDYGEFFILENIFLLDIKSYRLKKFFIIALSLIFYLIFFKKGCLKFRFHLIKKNFCYFIIILKKI